MDFSNVPERSLPPYERGPPLSYMERIAEKRQLEEVYWLSLLFLLAWTKSRKRYCTTPVGIGVGGGIGVSKKFNVKVFLCDGQGAVRRAILSL